MRADPHLLARSQARPWGFVLLAVIGVLIPHGLGSIWVAVPIALALGALPVVVWVGLGRTTFLRGLYAVAATTSPPSPPASM